MKKTGLNIFYLFLFTITPLIQTQAFASPPSQKLNLRILNFNIWHGLTLKNKTQMKYLEEGTDERFQRRVDAQIREIKLLDPKPDIIFLQEANYVKPISQKFAENLDMKAVYQVGACGPKLFLNTLSIPQKICSGLVILARKDLELNNTEGEKLSGTGFCNYDFCLQWSATRYAQKASVQLRGLPHKIILANAHLYYGFNAQRAIRKLNERNFRPRIKAFLEKKFEEGEEQRLGEVKVLEEFLKEDLENSNVLGVILAGDFNDVPQSETVNRIRELGFVTSYKVAGIKDPASTFSSENENVMKYSLNFKHPYQYSEATETETQEIDDLVSAIDSDSRKIDYIFLHENLLKNNLFKVTNFKVFGDKKVKSSDGEDFFMSDHFGIYIDLEVDLEKFQGLKK